MGKKWFEVSRP